MIHHFPLLSLLIWVPIIGAMLVLVAGGVRRHQAKENAVAARWIALIVTMICCLISIPLYVMFNNNAVALQFQEHLNWIPMLGIHYQLGIDGVSLAMILLTNFTGLIVVLATLQTIKAKVAQYMAALLVLQGLSVGVFAANDGMLFYLFWEAMLIPMYLCIGAWGDKNRSFISMKFFLYTFFGSALMLVALIYLGIRAGSFTITDFYHLHMPLYVQLFLFVAFLLAFAVKLPMWPLHTWLPDVHTVAPAGGSVILVSLMLKMGVYGFYRFNLPITPDASQVLSWMMIVFGLIAVVYVSLVAIAQKDTKRLIAYSSVAHMGFATLACFAIYAIVAHGHTQAAFMSLEGGVVQMISHAFNTGAMFLGVGILYDQLGSRMIKDYRGVASKMPVFAAFFMLFAMSNVGLPGTSGFVGEFMIILSVYQAHFWVAFFASSVLILGAAYTLWMYKRVFFGEMVADGPVEKLQDINRLQIIIFSLLALGVLAIGIYPNWLLNMLHTSVHHVLTLSLQHRI